MTQRKGSDANARMDEHQYIHIYIKQSLLIVERQPVKNNQIYIYKRIDELFFFVALVAFRSQQLRFEMLLFHIQLLPFWNNGKNMHQRYNIIVYRELYTYIHCINLEQRNGISSEPKYFFAV